MAAPTSIRLMQFPNVKNLPDASDEFIDDLEGLVVRISKIFVESQSLSRGDQNDAFSLIDQLRVKLLLCPMVQHMENDSYFHLAKEIKDKKADEKYEKYARFASPYIKAFNEIAELMKKRDFEFEDLKQRLIDFSICHDNLYFDLLKDGLLIS